MKSHLIARFTQLALPKRIVIISVVLLSTLLLLYSSVWSPFVAHLQNLRDQTTELQQQYNWMQSITPRLKALQKNSMQSRKTVTNVMAQTEKSLADANLTGYLQHVQQPQADEVAMTLKNVPFDKLIGCLQQLIQQYQLTIFSFTAQPSETFGTVNTQFTLELLTPSVTLSS